MVCLNLGELHALQLGLPPGSSQVLTSLLPWVHFLVESVVPFPNLGYVELGCLVGSGWLSALSPRALVDFDPTASSLPQRNI